jgi:hypothetical protein
MADGDMARLFHRLTSYEPSREWTDTVDDPWIVTSFEPNDPDLLPPSVKAFPAGLPVVQLPRELPEAMIFTCVGVPEYANRPGGPPGEPVLVRRVVPPIDD